MNPPPFYEFIHAWRYILSIILFLVILLLLLKKTNPQNQP
jgi:hypothetical protein